MFLQIYPWRCLCFVPIAHPFICKKFMELNIELFNVNINFKKFMITFLWRFFRFGVASTALIPSNFGTLVWSEQTSCGTLSIVDTFLMKLVESLTRDYNFWTCSCKWWWTYCKIFVVWQVTELMTGLLGLSSLSIFGCI